MKIPYGLSEDVVKNYIAAFDLSIFTKIKFMIFGRKIVEYAGFNRAVWYVYKNKLYLCEYKNYLI